MKIITQKTYRIFWTIQVLFFGAAYLIFSKSSAHIPGYFLGVYAAMMYLAVVFARYNSKSLLEIRYLATVILEALFLVAVYYLFLPLQCAKCDDISTYISILFTVLFAFLIEILISVVYLRRVDRFAVGDMSKIGFEIAPAGLLLLSALTIDYFL